jgi:micrococcal nuclease
MGCFRLSLIVAAVLGLGAGPAEPLHLRVVGVHDGDTFTGLDDSETQFKIRLDAIDAPELGQPFGQASKKALSEKVFGKDVVVVPKTKDKYGRTVGHVMINGRDVNLEMLEEGMAWHYKHYDHNARLARAEEEARAAKKGLWADRDPVPPWEWRASKRMRQNGFSHTKEQ